MTSAVEAPLNEFRDEKYTLLESHFKGLDKEDPYAYSKVILAREDLKPIFEPWVDSVKTAFKGVTTDGKIIQNLYPLQAEGAPTEEMVTTAQHIIDILTPEEKEKTLYGIDSEQWRKWSNPEIIFFDDCGLRLDRGVKQATIDAILDLLKSSLSEDGYKKVKAGLITNEFLGELINMPKILNRWSYFFMLFGTPSKTEPWGFTWHGHHVCLNVFIFGEQMTIGPCFLGAEPNVVDQGPHKGTFLLQEEEKYGLEFMQSLSPEQQKLARVFTSMDSDSLPKERYNPADQRHLAGAYQDNRIIPYEGIRGSQLDVAQQQQLLKIVGAFYNVLPSKPFNHRMDLIAKHLNDTYFSWIGEYGNEDPFYYRVQSPVVLVEFDHHSSLALNNAREPVKHHIHTIFRMPNGNDYGRQLLDQYRKREQVVG